MNDFSTLTTIASIIAGFGITMLSFRLQRELYMHEKDERIWIPFADRLVIFAILISLLLVIFPILISDFLPDTLANLPNASCTSAIILITGYIPSILAHYRLILPKGRIGARDNPEPSEEIIVYITAIISITTFVLLLFLR